MKVRLYFFLILSLSFNCANSQTWVFEFDKNNTTVNRTWAGNENNTYHNIAFMSKSGKDYRTGLIELNKDGELISYFRAYDCHASAFYIPYGQDSVVSVSTKCDGDWVNTFNLFNAQGDRITTKELDNKYSFDQIIENKDGISILRIDWRTHGDEYHIIELSLNDSLNKYSFPYADLIDGELDIHVPWGIKVNEDQYLLIAQLREVNEKSIITNHYVKVIFITNGEITWVRSFKDRLVTVQDLFVTQRGYLLKGKNADRITTVIEIDTKGNEFNAFHVKGISHGWNERFYMHQDRLFSIDHGIHGNTIYLQEYDLESGKQIWQKEIPTEYHKISSLRIGTIDSNHVILAGSFVRTDQERYVTAFVMRTLISDSGQISQTSLRPKAFYVVDELIQETSEAVLNARVYPNPARFKVTFEIDGSISDEEKRHLLIYNSQGTAVLSREFMGDLIEVDLSKLAHGTYLYHIRSDQKEHIIKGKVIVVD